MTEFLDIEQVAERYGVGKTTVRNWWLRGDIPAPIRLSRRMLRWRLTDLQQFEQSAPSAAAEQKTEVTT